MTGLPEAYIRFSLTDPVTVLSVDDAVNAMLGFAPENFLTGKVSLKDRIHDDDQDIADTLFSTEIDEISGTFNLRFRQANGRIRCLKVYYSKQTDIATAGVILELRLQDAKSLWQGLGDQPMLINFKAMMENTDDYIYFKDRNHVFTGASQTLVALTEPSEHWTDLLGLTDYDVFPEHYADVYYRLEKQVFSGIPVAHEIQETLDNEGKKGWVDNRKYPIKNEDGKIVGLFGIARDITEEKRIEQALRDSEEFLRESQIIAGLGSYTLDIPTGAWRSSAELHRVFGINDAYAHTLEGWAALIHTDDRAMICDYFRNEVLTQGKPFDKQYRIIRHDDGAERWVHSLGKLQFDAEGQALLLRGTVQDITERRDELLAEQRAILESRLVGIVITSNRQIVWTNDTLEAMFGYDHGELLGASTRQLYGNEEDYQSIGALYPDMERGVVVRDQCELLRKDGLRIWVEASGALLHREPREILWVLIDVTEGKRAEQAFKRESEKNLALLRNASDGIHILDINGNIIEVSDAFCNMLGYGRDEMIGMNVSRWDAQFTDSQLYRILRQHYIKQVRSQFETRHRRKDGTLFDVEVSGFALELDGKPVLFYSSRDITERKKTEAELRIAATAFESQEGMIITDANGVILRVNQAFTLTTGYTAEEVIGQNPRILKSGRQDAGFYAAMWERINSVGAWKGEIWNRRKNGEIYPEQLAITAVKDTNGCVTSYVATLIDITESKEATQKIEQLAFFDPLTHLPNRRRLLERIKQALASSAQSGKNAALLFIDLDNFKTLNDTLGHNIGDLLLLQVAQRIESCLPKGDTVSRLGSDEFVVILEGLSTQHVEVAAQTETIANKIMISLKQTYRLDQHEYYITASIGITLFNEHETESDELLKQADIAMHQAKKSGRNTIRFFEPGMQSNITIRAALEKNMRSALAENQFKLYYQPQIGHDGQVIGAEALIRWLHPEYGLVSPALFIPIAEETGMILSIGQWILETACAQIKAWQQDALTRELSLSVNVSAKQFRQKDFLIQVQSAIQRHGIRPSHLKLELTESILLENVEGTVAIMNAFKKIGVLFSLDDFGTGYSSLQYLKRLPLDQLKIDQSFVRDICVDSNDQAIVRTIIAMAQSLNLGVIAEGVETNEQRQALQNNGCTTYQGYLFGKPVPIEKFVNSIVKVSRQLYPDVKQKERNG